MTRPPRARQPRAPQPNPTKTHPAKNRPGRALAAGAAVLLALSALYLALLGGGTPPRRTIGGPFTLTGGDGATVTEHSFGGKFLLVFFGYTACPDECPLTLASVADALARLGPLADRVQPLFITVDPRHDTPSVVQRYATRFTPRLIGLTGSEQQIRAVAARYDIVVRPHRAGAPPGYAVDHEAVLFLMAPDGRLLAPIQADATADQIADEIRRRLT